jgi:hypothetical protein
MGEIVTDLPGDPAVEVPVLWSKVVRPGPHGAGRPVHQQTAGVGVRLAVGGEADLLLSRCISERVWVFRAGVPARARRGSWLTLPVRVGF